MTEDRTPVRLIDIVDVSNSTRCFRFMREDGRWVNFSPGQFYRFHFQDSKGAFERSYSLCNLGADVPQGALDLVISKVQGGRATNLLFHCQPGLKALVSGPYGRLVLPDSSPSHLLMVCTSVGIAPFLPMLDQIYRLDPESFTGTRVSLLFGIRSPEDCLYRTYLQQLAGQQPGFSVAFCFSQRLPEAESPSDFKGYVQERLKALPLNPESDLAYLCGNPHMIDESFSLLKSRGFVSRRVIREKYVFAREAGSPMKAATKLSDADKALLAEKISKYRK